MVLHTAPSTTEATVNPLKLIWNKHYGVLSQPQDDAEVLQGLVGCILESLTEVDATSRIKLENILVRIGEPAIPLFVEGLKAEATVVRSVCFMVLVRIGQPAVKAIQSFYKAVQFQEEYRWVADLLLQELNMQFPSTATAATTQKSVQYTTPVAVKTMLNLVAP
jgi:hypothetical protein